MNILVVGLGLIGGSFAKSAKKNTDYTVLGLDCDKRVLQKAVAQSAIDRAVGKEQIGEADFTFVALYPKAAADFIKENADRFKKGSIVMDGCGIKTRLYEMLGDSIKGKPFTFIGGHPMAGREVYGFDNAVDNLFDKAPLIITPENADETAVQKVKQVAKQIGFKSITVTDMKTHDYMIAYTSQLAHVLACSYIFDPLAKQHNGFSAGSFMDVTRVARINETMWAELFLENREALSNEIQLLMDNLAVFKQAIDSKDEDKLRKLMRKSCDIKEQL